MYEVAIMLLSRTIAHNAMPFLRQIIHSMVRKRVERTSGLEQSEQLNFTSLATQMEGFLPTDLNDLVSRAIHEAVIRDGKDKAELSETVGSADSLLSNYNLTIAQITLMPADFQSAQIGFIPLSLRNVKLQKSDVLWEDVGG